MQKNVASQKIGGQMVSATDGSAFTGAVTVAVTIDAGTQATGSVGSGACTHEGNGYHTYAPAQAETNGTLIAFTFTGTGAVPATVQVFTTGFDITAAQVPANATQLAGQTVTAAAGVTFPTSVASPTNITAGTITTVTNLTNAPTSGDLTATMKTSVGTAVAASAVASVTGNVGGNVVGSVASVTAGVTVTTNNDKTGYGLSAAAVQAIWDALTSALTTVGSIGKRLVDNLTGDIYARLGAPAGASVSADIAAAKVDTAAIKVKTDQLAFTTANQVDARVLTNSDKTGYAIASGGVGSGAHAAAELNAIADAVLDRNMATGTDSGTDSTSVRTVRQALRRMRNREAIAAGTGTVYKEDDTTASFTYAATTAAGNPLSEVNPT